MKLLKSRTLDRKATSRRALLKALGVSAAAAPFVPALDGWAAPGTKAPQRLVLLFAPHGVNPAKYWPVKGPTGAETDFALPAGDDAILKPLWPHKADMIFFDGLKRDTFGPGDHERLFGSLWTAGRVGMVGKAATAISIDQTIANRWAPASETSFPVAAVRGAELVLGRQLRARGGRRLRDDLLGPERQEAGRVGSLQDVREAVRRRRGHRRRRRRAPSSPSCAPSARACSTSSTTSSRACPPRWRARPIGRRSSTTSTAVREVEKTLQAPAATCGAIESPEGMIDSKQNDNHPKLIPIMNKLLTAALRCDRTRVASMQYSRAFSQLYFRWMPGIKADRFHHDISHMANDPRIGIIQQWYQARFAELLQMFKDVTEFGEPMLNNMLVVNAMEMETAWNHNCANRQPNWMAGKLGGVIPRTGRLLDYKGANDHNQFLVTILHAFGLTDINKIGDLGTLPGNLPGVLG